MSRWLDGKVLGQKAWTGSLFSLFIAAPIEPFVAGQFTQIGLSVGETILFRPYSFVNSPDDPILEFYYTSLPEGHLTPLLISLKPEDPIFISRKASGRFTLEQVPDAKILWLFATGTGLGVFLSLLRTSSLWQRFAEVILVHSVRQAIELTHQDIIMDVQTRHGERFQYVPVVTRENLKETLADRIPALLFSGALEAKVGVVLAPAASHVMLCGNPSMVKEVTALLLHRGLDKNNITIESYWKEPTH